MFFVFFICVWFKIFSRFRSINISSSSINFVLLTACFGSGLPKLTLFSLELYTCVYECIWWFVGRFCFAIVQCCPKGDPQKCIPLLCSVARLKLIFLNNWNAKKTVLFCYFNHWEFVFYSGVLWAILLNR